MDYRNQSDEAYRARARQRERDQRMTNLRALALGNQRGVVQGEPISIEGGHRGRPRIVTLTFYMEAADYYQALRDVKAITDRRAG